MQTKKMIAYHYTTLDAFSSIVQKGELWLTDTEFLDDRLELAAYREPLRRAAQEIYGPCSAWPRAIEGALGQLTTKDHEATNYLDPLSFFCFRHYVLCLCEKDNNRHLWRQYACRNGEYGCCLELDVEVLARIIRGFDERQIQCDGPKRVSYSPEDATSLFCDCFCKENQRYDETIRYCPDLREQSSEGLNSNLNYLFERVRPFIKNSQHQNEQEISFLVMTSETMLCVPKKSGPEKGSYVKWRYRETGQYPVLPYLAIGFHPYMRDVVKSVTLSPAAFSDSRIRDGIEQLLLHNGLDHLPIRRTTCFDSDI